jgi:hypothetical protein
VGWGGVGWGGVGWGGVGWGGVGWGGVGWGGVSVGGWVVGWLGKMEATEGVWVHVLLNQPQGKACAEGHLDLAKAQGLPGYTNSGTFSISCQYKTQQLHAGSQVTLTAWSWGCARCPSAYHTSSVHATCLQVFTPLFSMSQYKHALNYPIQESC